MQELTLDPVRFAVEHRTQDGDGGPTLRVFETAPEGRELLRFDCFEQTPHWHLAPWQEDRVTTLDREADNVSWTMAQLSSDLDGLLARAGLQGAHTRAAQRAAALRAVEGAMRNPPFDPDALTVDALRQRKGEKWSRYPADTLAAWVADMDFPVAQPIRKALLRATLSDDLGYPLNPTAEGLPTLFSARMRERFAWSVDPHRVEMITDVVQGIFVALLTCTDEGDGVVIQTPIYPPFLGAVQHTGRRVVEAPLVAGTARFEIDFDALAAALDGARMLLLCHPHNPTGRAFERAELERIAELAVERDVVVVSDEIHGDLVYPGRVHVPLASLGPQIEARTLTLTSASKAFNIAGLRLATAAFGSVELKRRFQGIPRHARGGINAMGMAATEAAWRHSQPWLDQVLAYLDENRRLVQRFVGEEMPGVKHRLPEATYLYWLDCNALDLPESPYDFFLNRARVATNDGRSFGPPGDGCVRINFATSRAILTEILERMAKSVS